MAAVQEEQEVVRWERVLPRMHLRVLLVEADDSTRQIIAALLRKCGYRVAAVGDGLKAWETLKQRGKHIDLVLAEVELPSMSGFCLPTAMMEHESWRNIPVIMMSSQDSASVVFKCMLQGAADFLTKPIRKNELKNLWQHVWRRQNSINSKHPELHGNQPQAKVDSFPINYAGNNENSETGLLKHRGPAEKENETERFCIKSETNVTAPYMHTKSSSSFLVGFKEASIEDKTLMFVSLPENKGTHHQDELKRPSLEMSHYGQDADVTKEEEKPFCEDKTWPLNEAMNLIVAIDNQPSLIYRPKAHHFAQVSDSAAGPVGGKGVDLYISTSNPLLELSLKSSHLQGSYNCENEEKNGWNHSCASAFSWYCNSAEKRIIQHGDSKLRGSIGNLNRVHKENQILDDASGSLHVKFIPPSDHHGEVEIDSVPSRFGALVQPVFYGLLEPRFLTVHSADLLDEVRNSPNVQSWQYTCSSGNNVQLDQSAIQANLLVLNQKENSMEEGPTCGNKENNICLYGYNLQLDQSAIQVNLPMTNQSTNSTEEAMKNKPTCGTKKTNILYCGSTNLLGANEGEANDGGMNSFGAPPAADAKTDERQCTYKTEEGEEIKKFPQREAGLATLRMKRKDRCFERRSGMKVDRGLQDSVRVKRQFVRRQL